MSGVSPLRGARLLRCASSRCQRPSVSPLTGGHPSRGLAATLRARWRAGCRRTAAWGIAGALANASDQGCAFIAMPNSQVRPAVPAGMTTAARSRARGSQAIFPSRVRERGPLDELTGRSVHAASLRSLHAGQIVTPNTRRARSRAAECDEVIGPARPPRQSLTFGSLGVTSAAEAPDLRGWAGASAATAAPDKLAHRSRRCVARTRGSACASRPTALPPPRPRQV